MDYYSATKKIDIMKSKGKCMELEKKSFWDPQTHKKYESNYLWILVGNQ